MTFYSPTGAEMMLLAVSEQVMAVEGRGLDVHTVSLVLNGQHGEFDLIIEATDDDLENKKFHGVAHRNGGVSNLKEVDD